jgi:hypothetical protein
VELRHDYPFELGIEGTPVPIMALLEAVAEKAVAYGIYRPPKHYADLAFAADVFQAELIAGADAIREIAAVKFAGNKERFSRLLEGQGISDFDSMLPSFESNRYLAPIKYSWTSEVRFVGEAALSYSFSEASRLVNERIVPILFPRRTLRR